MPAFLSHPRNCFGITEEYRNYCLDVVAHGTVYLGAVSQNHVLVYEQAGTGLDDLIQSMRGWVDVYIADKAEQRGDAHPSAEEYQTAVVSVYPLLMPAQQALMSFHAHSPNEHALVDDLLDVAEVRSSLQLILDYASIARRLSDALCYQPSLNDALIDPIVQVLLEPTGFIATRNQTQELVLLPEVGLAFRACLSQQADHEIAV
jgi:hypothetical protein